MRYDINSGTNDYFPECDDELPEHALFIGDLSRSVDEVMFFVFLSLCLFCLFEIVWVVHVLFFTSKKNKQLGTIKETL